MAEPAALHIQARESDPVRVVDLRGGSIRIGRAAFCDVRIADPDLADEECRLRRRGGVWQLVPAERGTSVTFGGRPLGESRPLGFGESFRVGSLVLTLQPADALPTWDARPVAPEAVPTTAPTRPEPPAAREEAVAARADLTGRLRDEWRDREARSRRRPADLAEKRKWESRLRAVGAQLRSDAVQAPMPTPPGPASTPRPAVRPAAFRRIEHRSVPETPPRTLVAPVAPAAVSWVDTPATPPAAPNHVVRPDVPRWRDVAPSPTAPITPPAPVARIDASAPIPGPRLAPTAPAAGASPRPAAMPSASFTPALPPVESRAAVVEPSEDDAPDVIEPASPAPTAPDEPPPIQAVERLTEEVEAEVMPTPVVVADAPSAGHSTLITSFDELDDDDFQQAANEAAHPIVLGSAHRREIMSEPSTPAPEARRPVEGPAAAVAPVPDEAAPAWLVSSWLAAFSRGREEAIGQLHPEPTGDVIDAAFLTDAPVVESTPHEAPEPLAKAEATEPVAPPAEGSPVVDCEATSPGQATIEAEAHQEHEPQAVDSGPESQIEPEPEPAPRGAGGATRHWFGPDPAETHSPHRPTASGAWSNATPGGHANGQERGHSAREWPTVSDILAAQGGRRRPAAGDSSGARKTPRAAVEVPTVAVAPGQWSLPLWLAWLPAATVAAGVGSLGCLGGWIWARDAYNAGVVASRLEPARDREKPKPLPEGVTPGRSSWWATTGTHLIEWAAYLDRNATDPAQADEARTLLDQAVAASPLHPTARYALAHPQPGQTETPSLARSLGQTRDVAALTWAGRRLLAEGKKEAALRAYAAALDMAAHADPARAGTPPFLDDAQTKRYALPGEELIASVVRDLADAKGLTHADWSAIVPARTCARVVTARVLRDRVSPDADAALEAALAEVTDAPEGTPAEVALHLAAQAETLALKGRWSDAEERYRQAIDAMPLDRIRRSWWINVADLALRLNEDDSRREALDAAKSDDTRDEITQRAVDAQRDSGLTARRDAAVRTARANGPRP